MRYLLDTNVLSEIRKPRGDEGVKRWVASTPADSLHLSALVVAEIRRGVERLKRRDPEQAAVYEAWLDTVLRDYDGRIISVDVEAADEWGRMSVPDPVPVVDGLMAATAKVRGMTFVTRNTADVERTGVAVLDPFSGEEP